MLITDLAVFEGSLLVPSEVGGECSDVGISGDTSPRTDDLAQLLCPNKPPLGAAGMIIFDRVSTEARGRWQSCKW